MWISCTFQRAFKEREQVAKSLMVGGCLGVLGTTRQPVLLESSHQGTKWQERSSKRYCMGRGGEEGTGVLHANPVGPCRLL